MKTAKHSSKNGFTLAEMLVVVAIIGVLAGVVIVGYNSWRTTTTEAAIKSDLNGIAGAMENARNFSNAYPTSLPGTFTTSNNVQAVTIVTSEIGDFYCASAASANDINVVMYITSNNKQVQTGTCDEYTDVVVGRGLVGWWKFNGNANDASDYNNDGSGTNVSLTTGQDGSANSAYSFNGTTSYVNTSNNAIFNSAEVSMSAWVRPNSITGPRTIMAKELNYKYRLSGTGGVGYLVNTNGSGGWAINSTVATPSITNGSWAHVVFTMSISTGRVAIYVNGAIVGTNLSLTGPMVGYSANTLRIGSYTTGAEGFDGSIDDARFYNRALTASDVKDLYDADAS